MRNMMKKLYIMKVKGFGNRLKPLIFLLTCMPHDVKNDTVLSDTDLKALLLKLMPSSWQIAYL